MEPLVNFVSIHELRKLLHEFDEKHANVLVRFRLMGEIWSERFMKVIKVTDSGAFFDDAATHEYIHVPDLGKMIQFEIDTRWNIFQPYFHYQINQAAK
jgi:hypothetical protein